MCNTEALFTIASDIHHRRWQSGVIELLQCQQWRERSLFKARCEKIKDAPDRDVLIDKRNRLDLQPFWRPAIPVEYGYPPDERDGTPLPDEAVTVEGAWNPKAPVIIDDHNDGEVDAAGWTIGRKTQNETFSAYILLSMSRFPLWFDRCRRDLAG